MAELRKSSLYIEDKVDIINQIYTEYTTLSSDEKNSLNNWLEGRYKKVLHYITNYQQSVNVRIDFAYDIFRWGYKGVVAQDIDYMLHLIAPIIEKKIDSSSETYEYATFAYGTALFHYYRQSVYNNSPNQQFYNRAVTALSSSSQSPRLYLQQRSYFFLAQLYGLEGDFKKSVITYYKTISYDNIPQAHHALIYSTLTDYRPEGIFNNMVTVFTKENIGNNYFWELLQSNINSSIIVKKIKFIMKFNHYRVATISNENEVITFAKIFSDYINRQSKNISTLQTLYNSKIITSKGKAEVLFRMGEEVRDRNQDLNRAMLMFCESVELYRNRDRFISISSLILKNFSMEIREILKQRSGDFISLSLNRYCFEQSMGKSAWIRFIEVGFVSGYFEEEVEFLEYIKEKTGNSSLIRLIDTRLAFLYHKGHAGVRIHDYNQPNYHKAQALFKTLKDNPLVLKHLNHPILAIYNKLETINGNEHYLYFKNKKSDKLLVVFSCAFSYAHYTQLRTFYQKNRTNVLFLNNPKLNWYHGKEWDRVTQTIEKIVDKSFNKKDVICYFGSMGGYMALKVGLSYGFKTIVFNPQIDMNIWIKHRPILAPRLREEKELINIQDFDIKAFELTPIYYMTSSSIEDVEVFSIFIQKISLCQQGLFIMEKISDNIHAGVFGKIYKEHQQDVILNISNLQERYFPSKNYQKVEYQILSEYHKKFWNFLIESMRFRLIVQIINKEIFVATVRDDFSKKIELSKFDFPKGL